MIEQNAGLGGPEGRGMGQSGLHQQRCHLKLISREFVQPKPILRAPIVPVVFLSLKILVTHEL